MRSITSRVFKLETAQKRILRCLWCRLTLCDTSPSAQKRYNAEPESIFPTKCWYCGTKFIISLIGLNAHQREATILIYSSHPINQFTDERVYAAQIWRSLYRSEVQRYKTEKDGRSNEAIQTVFNKRTSALRDQKARRERNELAQRAIEFCEAQKERFRRLAGGHECFPLDQHFQEVEKDYPSSAYDTKIDDVIISVGLEKYSQPASRLRSSLAICNLHLQKLKKREACEQVLWDKGLPETLEEIRFFEDERWLQISKASSS